MVDEKNLGRNLGKNLRGAVVGVGYLGTFHAQKYKALSGPLNFDFVGVCDLFEAQAKKVGLDLGVPYFTDPQDLIGKVDFVSLATTTPAHFEMAEFFLSHGVHVNVEKPITVNSSDAQKLVTLARQKNLTLAVGHSERFSPVYAALKAKMQSPLFFELQRHAPFKARGAEVSVVHDLMIHDLDLLLDLDSSAVRVTQAQMGRVVSTSADWVTAGFSFASGRQAFISVSRLAPLMTRSIRVIAEKQVLIANFQTGDLEVGTLKPESSSEFAYETQNQGKGDNLLLETENYIRALQQKVEPTVPGTAGLKALELAEEVIRLAGSPQK